MLRGQERKQIILQILIMLFVNEHNKTRKVKTQRRWKSVIYSLHVVQVLLEIRHPFSNYINGNERVLFPLYHDNA